MDFTFDETQQSVRDLARQIFAGQASVERVKEIEASDDRIDRDLWAELAKADLLGLCLPEARGGGGFGMVELALVLEQQGRTVAPVPLLETVVAAMAIAELGTDEQQARWLPGVTAEGGSLTGTAVSVPFGHVADAVLVATDRGLFLADPSAAARDVAELTNRTKAAHLTFGGTAAEQVGDERAVDWVLDRYRTGL